MGTGPPGCFWKHRFLDPVLRDSDSLSLRWHEILHFYEIPGGLFQVSFCSCKVALSPIKKPWNLPSVSWPLIPGWSENAEDSMIFQRVFILIAYIWMPKTSKSNTEDPEEMYAEMAILLALYHPDCSFLWREPHIWCAIETESYLFKKDSAPWGQARRDGESLIIFS